ncbi:hypothetical protein B0H11DRAFT_2088499 [Mycena galericulata]|nr:hypothetical protein B0H11DRAFT_2088499 [Mycena galericulata]
MVQGGQLLPRGSPRSTPTPWAPGTRTTCASPSNPPRPSRWSTTSTTNYLGLASATTAICGTRILHVRRVPPRAAPYELFTMTGYGAHCAHAPPQLGAVVDLGIRMLVSAEDADFICNWLGGHAAVLAMQWSATAALANKLEHHPRGHHRRCAEREFARMYAAGHEVVRAAFLPSFLPSFILPTIHSFVPSFLP